VVWIVLHAVNPGELEPKWNQGGPEWWRPAGRGPAQVDPRTGRLWSHRFKVERWRSCRRGDPWGFTAETSNDDKQ
jgi:hypothetical protein